MAGTVRLVYLPGHGHAEVTIATNIPATNHYYRWSTTNTIAQYQGSPFARWRVVAETPPIMYDTTDRDFQLRPYSLFVNDSYTNGDIYCSVIGNPANSGAFPDEPLDSVSLVLTNYNLERGDTVYVDTGLYELLETLTITTEDSGMSNEYVTIIGSTNSIYTRFTPSPSPMSTVNAICQLDDAEFVHLKNLIFELGTYGLYMNNAVNCIAEQMTISGATNDGVYVEGGSSNLFYQLDIRECSSNGVQMLSDFNAISNSVIWGHAGAWDGYRWHFKSCDELYHCRKR